MQAARPPLLRGAILLIALAAIAIIMARGDSPAAATTYDPSFSISVSDPTPGAAADISINFSVDMPDAFPNVKTKSSIQFLPRQWGIHTPETDGASAPPVGGIAGTFNALTSLGLFSQIPCIYQLPVPFTMYDASVDTSNTTSALDIGGDLHPGGLGYSGQFAGDPATLQVPGDLGQPLTSFTDPDVKHSYGLSSTGDQSNYSVPWYMDQDYGWSTVYRDVDHDWWVSPGDIRLTYAPDFAPNLLLYPAGSVVQAGDDDETSGGLGRRVHPFTSDTKHVDSNGDGEFDVSGHIYKDTDGSGTVSYNDKRLFFFGNMGFGSIVNDLQLNGGITHYPDFLNQMFPPSVVGEPLARQFGAYNVLGQTAVSLNIVTYRPGQLPGYPVTLGYPNVVVLLNPVAPIEFFAITQTSDMCTPLSLVSTNLGVSKDNPSTFGNEAGYVRLTNPKSEKSHDFTLVTTSQPDADSDNMENLLDTCPLNPNTQDTNGRMGGWLDPANDPDQDGLDAACDPDPNNVSPGSPIFHQPDEDQDNYGTRADNCATVANGIEVLGTSYQKVPGFTFYWGITGDLIGPSNQIDTDGDDIGDACEGAETGAQCANDVDDDADGAINDGCPTNPADPRGETGAQCSNAVDDEGDGVVNDGCPGVSNGESGAQCSNDLDDDGDGKVNDGCPGVPNRESGAQCTNALDDDGDGKVNDGCPRVGAASETVAQCSNALDDDGDGVVNDGCAAFPATTNESVAQCSNAVDDDFDGVVNDGCARFPSANAESGAQCSNAVDDDFDGVVNDGCPLFIKMGVPETACDNNLDDDADGLVNDGCSPVDPGNVARDTITGHMHVVTLTQGVPIFKHGIKLNQLGGPKNVNSGARTYSMAVSNLGSSAEDVQVGLRVVEGCAAVSGPTSVSVPADGSASASFTVDFTGCAAGTYTVQADACHAGDAAPAGLFGSGACPGTNDGMTDPNPLDDAPIAKSVEVGSP